jgi:polar amino acid transport system permease protein
MINFEKRSKSYLLAHSSWIAFRVLLAAGILLAAIYLVFLGLGRNYTFHWEEAIQFLPFFNQGLLVTLQIAILGAVLAVFLGIVIALLRLSKFGVVRDLAGAYVHAFRNLPFLVILLLFFFGLGKAIKILPFEFLGQTYRPQFIWGVLALGVYESSYLGETFRAGIVSVHKAQVEAARSLGMNYFQLLRYVVLPQAFRVILPPLTGTLIALIKESSLLYLISVQELTEAARQLAIPSRPYFFEFYTILACYYLAMVVPLSLLSNWMESRLGISRASKKVKGHG